MAMIVRAIRSFDRRDKHYSKGQSYEVDNEVAEELIAEGLADLPVNPSILSEDVKRQYLSDAAPETALEPEPEDEPDEPKVMSTPRKKAKK